MELSVARTVTENDDRLRDHFSVTTRFSRTLAVAFILWWYLSSIGYSFEWRHAVGSIAEKGLLNPVERILYLCGRAASYF